MTNLRIVPTVVLVALVTTAPKVAAAQDRGPAVPARAEIGGSVTFIQTMPTGSPRFTLNVNSRHAIQTGADFRFNHDSYGSDVGALYTVEYRYTLPVRLQATRIFLTAGGAGSLQWYHRNAYTYTSPGYSYTNASGQRVTVAPREYSSPAHSGVNGLPPVYPIAGAGFEYRLNSRLLARVDAQVIVLIDEELYWVPRVSGGIVVPLGKRVR